MQIVFMVLSDHAALMLVPSMPPPPAVPPDGQPPLDPQTAMRNPSDASCLSLSEKAHALAGRPACVGNVAAPLQMNSSGTPATSNPSDARCVGWQVCLQMPSGSPAVRSGLCVPSWGSHVTLPHPATASHANAWPRSQHV